MKIKDIKDYDYKMPQVDIGNFLKVEQKTANNGDVETFYNLNDGISIDGVDELNDSLVEKYVCRSGDNLRFISYNKYGSIQYWWMIAKINKIYDSLETLEPGQTLYLLPKEQMNYIYSLILKGEDNE